MQFLLHPLRSAPCGSRASSSLRVRSSTFPGRVRLVGRLDVDALRRTLNEVVRRHETLRTHFETVDGAPVQVIAPALELPLPVTDSERACCRGAERAGGGGGANRGRNAVRSRRKAPLIRARLLRLGEDEHIAVVDHAPHRLRRLVDRRAHQRGCGLYAAYRGGTAFAAAGAAGPICRLRASGSASGCRANVLDKQLAYWKRAAFRRAAASRAAYGPAAAGSTALCGRYAALLDCAARRLAPLRAWPASRTRHCSWCSRRPSTCCCGATRARRTFAWARRSPTATSRRSRG